MIEYKEHPRSEEWQREALAVAYNEMEAAGAKYENYEEHEATWTRGILSAFRAVSNLKKKKEKQCEKEEYLTWDIGHIVASAIHAIGMGGIDNVHPTCIAAMPWLVLTKCVRLLSLLSQAAYVAEEEFSIDVDEVDEVIRIVESTE